MDLFKFLGAFLLLTEKIKILYIFYMNAGDMVLYYIIK